MRDEGVTKYECILEPGEAPSNADIAELLACRQRLFARDLIGVYPDGIGYGNVSVRVKNSFRFFITGTQTGAKPALTAEDFTEVVDYSIGDNRVHCRGKIAASSESMTHAAVYELNPTIGAVIHVHSRALWQQGMQRYPTTAATVAYGTPAMAAEMRRLYETSELPRLKMLIMAGHEEGLITFGATLAAAEQVLQRAISDVSP
jgi:ribulose-5-phosphate 4-epimerase/fuculose-1-phosphate aldolase